jgi:hypothetical protein
LPAIGLLHLDIVDVRVGDHHGVQLADQQVLRVSRLELLWRHAEVGADRTLVPVRTDEVAALVLKQRIGQNPLAQLLVRHHQPDASCLGQSELAVDEVRHGLPGQVDLVAELVPAVAVQLFESLIHQPHLDEELLLGDHPIADPHGRLTAGTGPGPARAPVDENQQDEDGDHAPQDELQVP